MPAIPETPTQVSPSAITAVLISAVAFLRELKLETSLRVEEILAATGVSKSRAYELKDALLEVLPSLSRPRGRPRSIDDDGSPVLEKLCFALKIRRTARAHLASSKPSCRRST
jgi:hypothetical protein